jgi:hypothetical protein
MLVAKQFQLGIATVEEARKAVDEGYELNRQIGAIGRAGECLLLKANIVHRGLPRDVPAAWGQAVDDYLSAFKMLAAGHSPIVIRCLSAVLNALLCFYTASPGAAAVRFRVACREALNMIGTSRANRGIVVSCLGIGLAAVEQITLDPELRAEAWEALLAADKLLVEREQPAEWAQNLLHLYKLSQCVGQLEGLNLELSQERIARARKIVADLAETFQERGHQNIAGNLRKMIEPNDKARHATARSDSPAGEVSNNGDSDETGAAEGWKPRYMLGFDFKQHGTKMQETLALLDQIRIAVLNE